MPLFRILTALAMAALLAVPVRAQAPQLEDLARYLDGLGEATASFRQFNADGTVSTGQLYLQRPGRARFEYDPPDSALIMAGAGVVAVFDTAIGTVEQYPLRRTPLHLILGRNVDLVNSDSVVGLRSDAEGAVLTVEDPKSRDLGQVDLYFSAAPVALRGWQVRDGGGGVTSVQLEGLEAAQDLPYRLFNVPGALDEYSR